ncbi:MAG: hypothetical protein ACLU8S_02440 [Coprococcus phoceensis]
MPERYGPWNSVYSRFCKWIDDGILITSSGYSVLKPNLMSSLWMLQSFRLTSTVQVQKKGAS